jgi:hypothetical protein
LLTDGHPMVRFLEISGEKSSKGTYSNN